MWIYIVAAIAAIVLAAVIAVIVLFSINPNKVRLQKIDGADGYVKAAGTNLYDGHGDIVRLIGVNLGNWFIQEYWMAASKVGDYETGVYTTVRGARAMRDNPLLTAAQAAELYDLYMQNYIAESDFKHIAELGMNTVRIPFSCYNMTEQDGTLKPDAFKYLDFAVGMCEKYGLYAVLDLHGAFGSQNMDIHSGDDEHFDLYGNAENRRATAELWKAVATRYKDNTAVAAYDLLNEPRRKRHRFGGRINFDFYDELYKAVRSVDDKHLIMIECFSFPTNGARLNRYDWHNICMEYHIYNLTPFSITTCNRFYKALHNLMGYKTPVYIGEWNAFKSPEDWEKSFAYFDKYGWSHTSWTYKTNSYPYKNSKGHRCNWGLYELYIPPVDLSRAGFEEIADVYEHVRTENAEQTVVHDYWTKYLNGKNRLSE